MKAQRFDRCRHNHTYKKLKIDIIKRLILIIVLTITIIGCSNRNDVNYYNADLVFKDTIDILVQGLNENDSDKIESILSDELKQQIDVDKITNEMFDLYKGKCIRTTISNSGDISIKYYNKDEYTIEKEFYIITDCDSYYCYVSYLVDITGHRKDKSGIKYITLGTLNIEDEASDKYYNSTDYGVFVYNNKDENYILVGKQTYIVQYKSSKHLDIETVAEFIKNGNINIEDFIDKFGEPYATTLNNNDNLLYKTTDSDKFIKVSELNVVLINNKTDKQVDLISSIN